MYLDYDGVLHHENCRWNKKKGPILRAPPGYTLFQHADLLSQTLRPYPELKIVLSTSWVRRRGFHRAARRLPAELRARVIGATWHSENKSIENEWISASRGMQVWGDVVRRNPSRWIALDDDYIGWPKWALENLIQTDEVMGISEPRVMERLKLALDWVVDRNGEAPSPERSNQRT